MKKTSIALVLGLIAIGCAPAPAPAPVAPANPAAHNDMMKKMMEHKGPGTGVPAGTEDKKDGDKPAEGEKPADGDKPAEDK